jgi:hypothetical protein
LNARIVLRIAAILVLGSALGCFGSETGRYVPSPVASRQALETALGAWQKGQAVGLVPGTSPAVSVVDSKRKARQQLEKYEIVKEESQDGNTFFSVKLTLKNPNAEEVARFVVVGRDPLWVYREEDFKSGPGM